MKKNFVSTSAFFNPRIFAALVLCSVGAWLASLSFAAPTPTSGTLSTSNRTVTYSEPAGMQTPNETGVATGQPICIAPTDCSTFDLTIDSSIGTAASGYDPTQYQINMQWSWSVPTVDYDIFVEDSGGNNVAVNNSTADPSGITLPTTTPPGVYHIVIVLATGAPIGYNASIKLEPKPAVSGLCGPPADCTPPRYQSYSAGTGQADNAGEPSLGVDWNPNVASLKFQDLTHNVNHGGVAFFTSGPNEWRVNFDDCCSPARNTWEDVSAVFDQQFVLSDPIGFVDHYSNQPLGLIYPPPLTPGRVFSIDLLGGQGDSVGAYSDTDGNSYLPGGTGGPGQGPDHETLGGGPYNPNSTPPPPPQTVAYGSPNAIYYCSQNIVAEAQCSRSDDGGQTFGPGVPIYTPTQCTGGIHGHVKVARDGTVYVPNSSCGTVGNSGVAVSTDNGLTWTENNVPGSTGSQDPSVGIGQNDVGKPAGNLNGTNTIYLGWTSGDGHAHVAHSGDRGATWAGDSDVGSAFGVTHAVFPVVVAGDDNRAAFGFLGTGPGIATSGTCDPYGATLNCANIWHLYVATTYDGGTNWIVIDGTPDDPVQQGTICLQGTTCAGGRNLLDFNDFAIDAEGRGLVGYADGCVSCGNTFQGQSNSSHGTVTRQSGGRRLFAHFDPNPPEPVVPAAPQMISAAVQSSPPGNLITWLEPDNGGSPIISYKVYGGATTGSETLVATVNGVANTKYLDTTAGNQFYYVTAVNGQGEGTHCGEVSTSIVVQGGTPCSAPYVEVDGASTGTTDPTMGELTIQSVNVGEPFTTCSDHSITFTMKVQTLSPAPPPNSAWTIYAHITDDAGHPETIWVAMDTIAASASPAFPEFSWGRQDPSTAGTNFTDTTVCTAGGNGNLNTCPTISGSVNSAGLITIKLTAGTPLSFPAPTGATGSAFTWTPRKGNVLSSMIGQTLVEAGGGTPIGFGGGILFTLQTASAAPPGNGTYTMQDNLSCNANLPIAALTVSPQSGPVSQSFSFNGTSSHEPSGACGTINSYTINFGDGNTATNSTGMFTHTYSAPGDYTARLTVQDTTGLTSTNVAQVVVTVTGGIPPLNGVVSRKTHGTLTPPGDLVLTPNTPATIECRTGGIPSGNHTLVFSFVNTLNAVTSVTATATTSSGTTTLSPTGGIGVNTGTGSHQNEYTVTLTGVPNASHLSVTLHGVTDSALNSGDIPAHMDVLFGDVNSTGRTDAGDVTAVRNRTVSIPDTTTASSFRYDVNISGRIDAGDVTATRNATVTVLPP
jgi:PKD repeat protein